MINISFVIPVYNEQERLIKTQQALETVKIPAGFALKEIIFVNDGSTDKTLKILKSEEFCRRIPHRIKIITYKQNQGKGYAIKCGMLAAKGDYILFFDADMSTPLSELQKFVPFMVNGADVIIGTRKNGKSTVIKHQPWLREHLGRGFTKITQLMLNVHVTDFTCGFKAFSSTARDAIFPQAQINRWGYDAEILFLASRLNLSMQEKAVTWENDDRTRVKLIEAIPQTFMELGKIHYLHTIRPVLKSIRSHTLTRATQVATA